MITKGKLKQALYYELNKLGKIELNEQMSQTYGKPVYSASIVYLHADEIETKNIFDGYVKLGDGQVLHYTCELKDIDQDTGLQSIDITNCTSVSDVI